MYFTESHMLVSVSRWIFLASSWRLKHPPVFLSASILCAQRSNWESSFYYTCSYWGPWIPAWSKLLLSLATQVNSTHHGMWLLEFPCINSFLKIFFGILDVERMVADGYSRFPRDFLLLKTSFQKFGSQMPHKAKTKSSGMRSVSHMF